MSRLLSSVLFFIGTLFPVFLMQPIEIVIFGGFYPVKTRFFLVVACDDQCEPAEKPPPVPPAPSLDKGKDTAESASKSEESKPSLNLPEVKTQTM